MYKTISLYYLYIYIYLRRTLGSDGVYNLCIPTKQRQYNIYYHNVLLMQHHQKQLCARTQTHRHTFLFSQFVRFPPPPPPLTLRLRFQYYASITTINITTWCRKRCLGIKLQSLQYLKFLPKTIISEPKCFEKYWYIIMY